MSFFVSGQEIDEVEESDRWKYADDEDEDDEQDPFRL